MKRSFRAAGIREREEERAVAQKTFEMRLVLSSKRSFRAARIREREEEHAAAQKTFEMRLVLSSKRSFRAAGIRETCCSSEHLDLKLLQDLYWKQLSNPYFGVKKSVIYNHDREMRLTLMIWSGLQDASQSRNTYTNHVQVLMLTSTTAKWEDDRVSESNCSLKYICQRELELEAKVYTLSLSNNKFYSLYNSAKPSPSTNTAVLCIYVAIACVSPCYGCLLVGGDTAGLTMMASQPHLQQQTQSFPLPTDSP